MCTERVRRRRHGYRFISQVEGDNGRRGGRGLSAVRSHILQPVRLERGRRRRTRGRRSRQQQVGRQTEEK